METNRDKIIELLYTGQSVNVELALQLAASQGLSLTEELKVIRYFYNNGSKGAIRNANLEEAISIEGMIQELRFYRYASFNSAFRSQHHAALSLLEKLAEIYFYYPNFETIPSELYQLKQLWRIVLLEGELKNLAPEIANLEKLRILRLTKNKLETIPENIGKLAGLQELYLNNNKLKNIPKSIGQLQDLKVLFLGGNQLETLPKELTELKKLTKFSVYSNPLDRAKIPKSLFEGDSIVAQQLRRIFP